MAAFSGLRGRNVRVKLLSATSVASLETAVQAFLDSLTEEVLLSIDYAQASNEFSVLITFTR